MTYLAQCRFGVLPLLFLATSSAQVVAQGDVEVGCEASAASLSGARDLFTETCAPLLRVDCDPSDNGWTCSSAVIGNAAPGGRVATPEIVPQQASSTPAAAPEDASPPAMPVSDATSECVAVSSTLDGARLAYEASCLAPRIDCDPVGGGWSCSSGVIGGQAPGRRGTGTPPAAQVQTIDNAAPSNRPTPSLGWADSYSFNGVCYIDTTFDHGVGGLFVQTPQGRMTIRRAFDADIIAPGPGISRADALYNDIQCGNGPANDAGDEDPDQCPGRVDQGVSGCTVIGPRWSFQG